MRAALVLCADHELNVSAFTARCVASAGAHPYAVVIAGLAALEGPKHGGASARVESMLESLRQVRPLRGALEARLRVLEHLGSDPAPMPRSKLRVVALDRSGGTFGNGVLGTYVTVSLTQLLRHASPGRPWRHTLCVAGAERLTGEVLDRLTAACETTRTGWFALVTWLMS